MNKNFITKAFLATLSILLINFSNPAAGQTIPEEARRFIQRGVAAIEMAKTQADYSLALQEFEQAAKLAPNYPDVYYNMGTVNSKLGNLSSAIKNFQRYLELAPDALDATKVREEIYKLEYRRDRQNLEAALSGTWTAANKKTFQVVLDGSKIEIKRDDKQGDDDILTTKVAGRNFIGPFTDVPLNFRGTMIGNKISGQYINPAGTYSGNCDLPERKGSFDGIVDVAAGQIRIVYNRVQFEYETKFVSIFSDQLVCRQTNRREQSGYVLELKNNK